MSKKGKGLSNFLDKQKKGSAKKDNPAETKPEDGTTAKEGVKDQTNQFTKVAEEFKKAETVAKKDTKDDNDSEEEDESPDLQYGVIKEVKVADQQQKQTKVDYFEEKAKTEQKPATKTQNKPSGEIQFGGGKPKFGRGANKAKLGAGFSKGLDDLDEDGDDDQGKQGPAEEDTGPSGRREFFNLSSSVKTGDYNEENKMEPRPAAVKPTFRGKANLRGTGAAQGNDDQDTGPKHTYDFAVAFRGQGDYREDRTEEGRQDDRQENAPANRGRGGRRGGRGGRGGFGPSQAQQDADEGFEVVRGGRKPRNKFNNDSDSDETQAQGGARGGRERGERIERGDGGERAERGDRGGRGGFFTNSGKNRVQE